jgi:hypothetical protein
VLIHAVTPHLHDRYLKWRYTKDAVGYWHRHEYDSAEAPEVVHEAAVANTVQSTDIHSAKYATNRVS